MFRHFSRRYISIAILLTAIGGCKPKIEINPLTAREQIRDSLMAALSSFEREALVATENPSVKRFLGIGKNLPSRPQMRDANVNEATSMLASSIKNAFDGNLGQALFRPSNVKMQNKVEIEYALTSDLCPFLPDIPKDTEATEKLKTACTSLLSGMDLRLHIRAVDENAFALTLLLENKTLFTLNVAPNQIAQKVELASLYELMMKINDTMEIDGDLGKHLAKLDAIGGIFSWKMQFASKGYKAGCLNGERMCLQASIDEDLFISERIGGGQKVNVAKTTGTQPGLYISNDNKNGMMLKLNGSAIDGNMGPSTFHIPKITADMSIPKDDSGILTIRNLQVDNESAWMKAPSMNITVDLNKDKGGTIEDIQMWSDVQEDIRNVIVDLNPLQILMNVRNPQNGAHENLEINLSDNNGKTRLRFPFKMSPNENPKTGESFQLPEDEQDNSKSLLLPNLLKQYLSKQTQCSNKRALNVEKGNVTLIYDYSLRQQPTRQTNMTVSTGQCLEF